MPSSLTSIGLDLALAVFWASLGLIVYIYAGYLVLLRLLRLLLGRRQVKAVDIEPTLTLVISAYNEEAAIRQKLENSLGLDYPPEKLQVLVVDDASSDRTGEIAEEFAGRGVVLLRNPGRRGKTWGLNRALERASGDVILFSDANIFYHRDAVRKLVRNFADPAVGCVTGESRYRIVPASQVGHHEDAYWRLEQLVKVEETARGSMVGSDGAIFAIRRELYEPLDAADINDFLIPLRIVARGCRNIYEPEAVGEESGTEHYLQEFRRKVRIVNRSWGALWRCRSLLNPLRFGWFSLQLTSHKLLRWCMGLWLIALLGTSAVLHGEGWVYRSALYCQLGFYGLAILGGVLFRGRPALRHLTLPYYFCMVNAAALIGVARGIVGRKQITWEPEARGVEIEGGAPPPAGLGAPVGFALLLAAGLVGAWISKAAAAAAVWASIAALGYVYLLYPAILGLVARLRRRRVARSEITPSVALVIAAHNEEQVIGQKLGNTALLDYPRERLQVTVVSDGSTDRTVEIVQGFADGGVRLIALPSRLGKAAALAEASRGVEAEVVAFSDANVMCHPQALRLLVRSFADPEVGAVTGNVRLINDHLFYRTSEDIYCHYEERLFRDETAAGTLIAVDGAMYAVRRECYEPPPAGLILDDFAISMGVLRRGRRVVYDAEALGYEVSPPSVMAEFDRKSRLVAGAVQFLRWGGLRLWPRSLLAGFQYLSHKILRWLTPLFLLFALYGSVLLGSEPLYRAIFLAQAGVYLLALAGFLSRGGPIFIQAPFYFCMVSLAAAVGLYRGLLGRSAVRWRKHERLPPGGPARDREPVGSGSGSETR